VENPVKKISPILVAACLLQAVVPAHAASRLPFTSSFETGNFSEWGGGLEASMTVTTQDATQGRYSTQAVMTRGQATDNYKEYLFGYHPRTNGGDPVTVQNGVWLRLDSKFDQGFQFGTSAPLHKVALINLEDENSRRRYQIIINVWTATREYGIEHLKWNADRTFNTAMAGVGQNIGTPVQARLGEWDRLKLFIKPNTRGAADGIVRLWVNGVLKAERTNVALREDTDYMPNKLLMVNYVTDTTTAGTQRWDNFYLGESDPDAGVRPMPPVQNPVQ
jgi:hypothetical protein